MIKRCLKTGYLRAIQAGDILGEEEFTVGFLDQERPKPLLRFKGSFLTETGWGRPEQVGVTGKQKAGEKENKRKKNVKNRRESKVRLASSLFFPLCCL